MIKNKLSTLAGEYRVKMSEIARATGIHYSSVQRLYNAQVNSIDFDTLNKLCIYFECTPNDILEFISET